MTEALKQANQKPEEGVQQMKREIRQAEICEKNSLIIQICNSQATYTYDNGKKIPGTSFSLSRILKKVIMQVYV